MKSNQKLIIRWSEFYLDTLELLYGEFNLYPDLTVAEVCEEWKECFRADSQTQVEAKLSEAEGELSGSYLDALQALHGEIDLHPVLTIEEIAEEWKENFREDGKQLAIKRRQDLQIWSDSYMAIWPLQSAS